MDYGSQKMEELIKKIERMSHEEFNALCDRAEVEMGNYTSNSTLCCHWCQVPLGNATKVTLLNGNLPVCDLCLMKAKEPLNSAPLKGVNTPKENDAWKKLFYA